LSGQTLLKGDEYLFKIFLQEYTKAKDEQTKRIGFRDNLLYVNLVVVSGILSYSISKEGNVYGLLLIPWATLVLGWTYLVNDEKISSIGRYIRNELSRILCSNPLLQNSVIQDPAELFKWETAHRKDDARITRKITQLCVDEMSFVISGLGALISFWFLEPNARLLAVLASYAVCILLIYLGTQIYLYADVGSQTALPCPKK
jgi:hypothetical protein